MELEYLKENIFDDLDFSDLDDDEIKAQEEIEINKSLKTIQKQDIANLIVDFNNTFNNIKDLKGKTIAVVANLKPAKLMGIESQGMVLAAFDGERHNVMILPDTVPAGTRIK